MAITTAANLSWDQSAWEKVAYFTLRPELYFDAVADVQPTNLTQNGSSVNFVIVNDLAVASTALNESTDITPATLTDSTVQVTLQEFGNAVQTTALIRGTSMIALDPVVADAVGFNAGISLDSIARNTLQGGSNVIYATGSGTTPTARNQVAPNNTLGAAEVRRSLAKLRGGNVGGFGNGFYTAFIHPDVSLDLRAQTGAAAWRDPHTYSQPAEIWNGEVGAFEGFRFIESPRGPLFADAGSSTTLTDVYRTMFVGRQSLAKAWSMMDGNGPLPRVVPGPVTDLLRRFVPMGWYWLGGYGRFREASIYAVESASSVGSN